MISSKIANKIKKDLFKKYPKEKERIKTGVEQCSLLWTKEDGNEKAFYDFCLNNFVQENQINYLLKKFDLKYESINGRLTALFLDLRKELDEDTGEMKPEDSLFSSLNLASHLREDLFEKKIAFLALLNFKAEKTHTALTQGGKWTREKWASHRLAQRHLFRVPSKVTSFISDTYNKSSQYVYSYNIKINALTGPEGEKLFNEGLRLISHWGLRDHLKTYYYSNSKENVKRQETIEKLMERIVYQEVPEEFINSDKLNYNPFENTLGGKKVKGVKNERYKHLRNIFTAHEKENPYYPGYETLYERRFNLEREIPAVEVKKIFESVLKSEAAFKTAELIKKRIGRELKPFDIWYDGFKDRGAFTADELDKAVSKSFPDLKAFEKNIPSILVKLGFDFKTADFLAQRIEVDPARGAGHAWGPEMKGEKAHLRTRAENGKCSYQTFNVAMHELGHCVEQVFSLYKNDYYLLNGVPNTAFTEAFAFVFQGKDLDILGFEKSKETKNLKALDIFWSTLEISGVALTDMAVWEWMHKKKKFSDYELKETVIKSAKDIWNKYYYPLFKVKDSPILAIYSHMIYHALYLPDYPLGHIIGWQIEEFFEKNSLGKHMERMCACGSITPKEWMIKATGEEISAKSLINSALKAANLLSGGK